MSEVYTVLIKISFSQNTTRYSIM